MSKKCIAFCVTLMLACGLITNYCSLNQLKGSNKNLKSNNMPIQILSSGSIGGGGSGGNQGGAVGQHSKSRKSYGIRVTMYNMSLSKPFTVGKSINIVKEVDIKVKDIDTFTPSYEKINGKYINHDKYSHIKGRGVKLYNNISYTNACVIDNSLPRSVSYDTGALKMQEAALKKYLIKNTKEILNMTMCGISADELKYNGSKYSMIIEPIGFFRFNWTECAMTPTEAAMYDMTHSRPNLRSYLVDYTAGNLPKSMYPKQGSAVVNAHMSKFGFTAFNNAPSYNFTTSGGSHCYTYDLIKSTLGVWVMAWNSQTKPPVKPKQKTDIDWYAGTQGMTTAKLQNITNQNKWVKVTYDYKFSNSKYNKKVTRHVYMPGYAIMETWSNKSIEQVKSYYETSPYKNEIYQWLNAGGRLEKYQTAWNKWEVPPSGMTYSVSITTNNSTVIPIVNKISGTIKVITDKSAPDPDPKTYMEDFNPRRTFRLSSNDMLNNNPQSNGAQSIITCWSRYTPYINSSGKYVISPELYKSTISISSEISPSGGCPSAIKYGKFYSIKSGYGIKTKITVRAKTTSIGAARFKNGSNYTWYKYSYANTTSDSGYRPIILATMPEFYNYSYNSKYHGNIKKGSIFKLLETTNSSIFGSVPSETGYRYYEFKYNKYDKIERVHYTPLWYPNSNVNSYNPNNYSVRFNVIGISTPFGKTVTNKDGIYSSNLTRVDDYLRYKNGVYTRGGININGSLYDDYQAVVEY